MTNRRIHGVALLAAAAVTFTPFGATTATAAKPFSAPEVTFESTTPGTVTATLHNPNDRGECWAEAGVGPENNHMFFGDSKPESLAGPGRTVETSLAGLESDTTITARGGCADTSPEGGYELGPTTTVTVS